MSEPSWWVDALPERLRERVKVEIDEAYRRGLKAGLAGRIAPVAGSIGVAIFDERGSLVYSQRVDGVIAPGDSITVTIPRQVTGP